MTDAISPAPSSPRARQDPRGPRRRRGSGSNHQFHPYENQKGHGFRGVRRDGASRGQERSSSGQSALTFESQLRLSSARPPGASSLEDNRPDHSGSGIISTKGSEDKDAASSQGQTADDGEVCFICASTIEHLSITPCNHQTCHICAIRLRALYKKRDCAYCKTEAPYVILTDTATKRYEEFSETDFVSSDESLGIKYEKDVILEDTILLLRYNCPDHDCDVACLGWPHLHRHVKQEHGKLMCDLCTRNKKVFTHEHELFTFGELKRHGKFGDDNPGAIDQSGFRGHPECGFCRERFYGDDELYQHCREKHERCHICDRRNPGSKVQYYLNYEMLEKHFAEAHFVCLDIECQANKTNVFESEMDLKAHQLSSHPNGLSKDARRDARLVNISSFDYRTPYQPDRRSDRDHRGNGRGRDPNAEALPTSSAQPLRRDELAYQRQMAILNAQPQFVARNHAASPVPAPAPRPVQPAPALPDLGSLSLEPTSAFPSGPSLNLTPQGQARQVRHDLVLTRASKLLDSDSTKLSTFRNHVSSYRSSGIGATELIDTFFSLFDVSSSELGKLVRELADIYEDETKRQGLLKAWNDWLSINADYPSLPGPGGILAGASSTGGAGEGSASGRRVLRLKSSTAQSSRSAVSRQGSWGNAHAAGLSAKDATDAFPALGGASTLSNGQKRTPWTGLPALGASSAARGSAMNNRPSSKPPPTMGAKANEEMFPALPVGKKPETLMAGLTRGAVRWDESSRTKAPAVNPWGGGNGGGNIRAAAKGGPEGATAPGGDISDGGADGPASAAFGKKGKKGKQVLYKFG